MAAVADRPLVPGDAAPDVTLVDTDGAPVRLADVEGPVMVVFFPFAFSGTCTGELCTLRDNIGDFAAAGVTLVGVSCDPLFSLRAWAEQQGFEFDLLSDFWPHGEASRAFGVFDEERGRAGRGSFLLVDGVVRWSVLSDPGVPRDLAGYRAAIAAL